MRTGPEKSQRGAALVVALLVVALVAGLGTGIAGNYLLNIRYQSNYLHGEQGFLYLLGAEALAKRELQEDHWENREYGRRNVDASCDNWSQSRPPFPFTGGSLSFRITDLSARFNINSLTSKRDSGRQEVPLNIYQARFIRLLQTYGLEITPEDAILITQAVYDWMDPDSEPTGLGGMEDDAYAAAGLDYRAANGPMGSVSELRLIPSISPKLYNRMKRDLTVWPRKSAGRININSASVNLLRALPGSTGIFDLVPVDDPDLMEDILIARTLVREDHNAQFFSGQINDDRIFTCGFTHPSSLCGMFRRIGKNCQTVGLSVNSNTFLFEGRAVVGGVEDRLQSVLQRRVIGGIPHVDAIVRSTDIL